jgi:hypothetical protein
MRMRMREKMVKMVKHVVVAAEEEEEEGWRRRREEENDADSSSFNLIKPFFYFENQI